MIDLVLETSWANKCVALAMQVVSHHCGRLPYGLLLIHTHEMKVEISEGLGECRNTCYQNGEGLLLLIRMARGESKVARPQETPAKKSRKRKPPKKILACLRPGNRNP